MANKVNDGMIPHMDDHPLKGRKQSPEHVAKRARKCEPGCECKRHKSLRRLMMERDTEIERLRNILIDSTVAAYAKEKGLRWP